MGTDHVMALGKLIDGLCISSAMVATTDDIHISMRKVRRDPSKSHLLHGTQVNAYDA